MHTKIINLCAARSSIVRRIIVLTLFSAAGVGMVALIGESFVNFLNRIAVTDFRHEFVFFFWGEGGPLDISIVKQR